jgi:hypothetical protein
MTRLPQPVADAVITLAQQRGIKHSSALRYYRRHGNQPLNTSAPVQTSQFPPTPGPLFKGRRVQSSDIMDSLRVVLNPTPTARIFVFGSNTAGIHGAGAARYALDSKGAVYGQGEGLQGESYAIPTRTTRPGDGPVGTYAGRSRIVDIADFNEIIGYVNNFLDFARQHSELEFQITRIGCGYAGYTDEQIAKLFVAAPSNCLFDDVWQPYLHAARFWGTF